MNEQVEAQSTNLIELAADTVAAYVANDSVPMSEPLDVIVGVHAPLSYVSNGTAADPAGLERPTPAQIKKSITPDALITFVAASGTRRSSATSIRKGMAFEAYRTRYGLPSDDPSTAVSDSAQRSELARSLGPGRQRNNAALEAGA